MGIPGGGVWGKSQTPSHQETVQKQNKRNVAVGKREVTWTVAPYPPNGCRESYKQNKQQGKKPPKPLCQPRRRSSGMAQSSTVLMSFRFTANAKPTTMCCKSTRACQRTANATPQLTVLKHSHVHSESVISGFLQASLPAHFYAAQVFSPSFTQLYLCYSQKHHLIS